MSYCGCNEKKTGVLSGNNFFKNKKILTHATVLCVPTKFCLCDSLYEKCIYRNAIQIFMGSGSGT